MLVQVHKKINITMTFPYTDFHFTNWGQDQCKNLCEKMQNGKMATVATLKESQKMFGRMNEVLKDTNGGRNEAGMNSQAAWTPIVRQESDGSWVDLYNKDPVKEIAWAAGQPKADPCAIFVIAWKGLGTYQCRVNIKVAPIYCPCSFPVCPHLTLRGLYQVWTNRK